MVIVQHSNAVPIRQGGDDEIDGREAMVSGAGELTLCVEGASLNFDVDVQHRQRRELT